MPPVLSHCSKTQPARPQFGHIEIADEVFAHERNRKQISPLAGIEEEIRVLGWFVLLFLVDARRKFVVLRHNNLKHGTARGIKDEER
jgi:hypothetical protein